MKARLLILSAFIFVFVSKVHADWQRDILIPQQDITDIEVIDSWLYFSSFDTIYRKSESTNIIEKMGTVGDSITISTIFKVDSRLIVGTYDGGVYESLDGGSFWNQRNSGLGGIGSHSVTSIASRGDSLYIGTSGAGIFVSSINANLNWEPFRNGLPWNSAWEIYSLYNWKDILFSGAGLSGYIYRNHRDSSVWNYSQFNDNIGTGLAMIGFGVTNEGILVGLGMNGIYYSHNEGLNWKFQPAPFNAALKGKVLSFSGRTLAIFSHVTRGIHIYEWIANEWILIDIQAGFVAYDFEFFDEKLYAASWDGLWFYPLNPTGVDPEEPTLPNTPLLSQNYPNPFNPTTTIEYTLPKQSHVTIAVYNVLGQIVRTLVDRDKPAGSYAITWDGKNDLGHFVATGAYLYSFRAGDHVETKKMLLQK